MQAVGTVAWDLCLRERMNMRRMFARIVAVTVLVYVAGTMAAEGQSATTKVFTSPGGTEWRVLVDAASLGGS